MNKNKSKVKDKVEILEIKLRHLKNQHFVIKQQYEKTTGEYLKILDEISKTNMQLQQEIAERKQTEEALKKAHDELEIRVQERTAELAKINMDLQNEITEHKKTVEALKEKEAFNFALFEYNPGETIVVDREGKITMFNLAKKKSGDRLPTIGDVMYKDYAGEHEIDMYAELKNCIRTGKVKKFTEQKYGNRILSITLSPFSKGAITISEDITERKKAEQALRESEERFRSLFESAPEFIHILDKNGKILQTNPAVTLRSGYTEEEMVGRSLAGFFTPASKKIFAREFSTLSDKRGHRAEVEFVCKDGTIIISDCSCEVVHDEQGKFAYIVSFQRNITEQKKAEEVIKKARDDYLAITNLTGDIIIHVDKERKCSFVNDGACEFFGKQKEELIGNTFIDSIHPDDRKKAIKIFQEMIKSKKIARGHINRYKTPGGWRTIEWNAVPLFDESGNYMGLQTTGRDITKHIELEEKLIEREAFNFALFEYNPIETIVVDREGKITMFNMAKKKSGDRLPAIGDVMYKDYAGKHEIDMFEELMECIKTNEVKKFPEMKYKDRFISITISPFTDGAITISEDITERKKAEEALLNSENRYRNVVEDMPALICRFFSDGKLTFVNNAYCSYFGKKREALIGYNFFNFIPKNDRVYVKKHFESLTKKRPIISYEHQVISPDGTIRYQRWTDRALFGKEDLPIEYQSIGIDITERKNIEKTLKEAQEELEIRVQGRTKELKEANKKLKKEITDRIKAEDDVKHQNKRIELLAKTSMEYVQLSPDDDIYQIIGNKLKEIVGDAIIAISSFDEKNYRVKTELIKGIEKNIERIVKLFGTHPLGMTYSVNEKQITPMKSGKLRKIRGGLYTLTFRHIPKAACKSLESILNIGDIYGIGLTQKGKIYGAIIIITFKGTEPFDFELIEAFCNESSIALQRWIVEDKIRKNEEKYHTLTENISEVIYSLNKEGTIMFVGPQIIRYGYDTEEVINHNFLDFILPEDRERTLTDFLKKMTTGEEFPNQFRIIDKNSGIHWIEDKVKVQRNKSGKIIGLTGILHDITERVNAEEALKISEKKLQDQKSSLEQKNIALREIIEQVEIEKNKIKNNIMINVEKIVLPMLERIRLGGSYNEYIDLLQDIIENLTSSYGREITRMYYKLTSREVEICNMIKKGLMNKEISNLLNISLRTVENHRKSIRNKLDLKNKNINLTTFLKQLQ